MSTTFPLSPLTSSKIVVIEKGSCIVKPAEPTWTGRLLLSELDQFGNLYHVPMIYFYDPPPTDHDIVKILIDSLSQVLVPFYPVAGRLHSVGRGRLKLECNAMGVLLVEAESESELQHVRFDFSLSEHKDLVPHVSYNATPLHELPLLLVQVTRFRCGGVCLGFSLAHVVADGTSALHFFSEWARISRGERICTIPIHDRTFLQSGYPPRRTPPSQPTQASFNRPPQLLGQTNTSLEREMKTAPVMLKISASQVEKLKSMANEWNENERGYSRYETITGHVWRCLCRARKHQPEQPTALVVSVDIRKRMQPPLPHGFFGNTIIDVLAVSCSGELISKPLGYASSKVREAIEMVNDEYARNAIEVLKNVSDLSKFQDLYEVMGGSDDSHEGAPSYGNPNLRVVSWLTLPLHGIDFGWGNEISMGPGYHDCDGDSLLIPSPGDASLTLAMCLQVDHMEDFKKYFYEDIMHVATT